MKSLFFTVIESQIANDAHATLADVYEDYNSALAKLYTILAAAATSQIEYHAGFIVRSDGIMTDGRVFDRRPEPQPEPDEV